MRSTVLPTLLLALAAAGCGADDKPGQESPGISRGGTMTVGDQIWTIVPSTQCSIYPGNVVSIAGHAAEDPSLEIVIDFGGPTGASIGNESTAVSWIALRDTLKIEIDGNRIRGTATFNQYVTGTGLSAEGSFDVTC